MPSSIRPFFFIVWMIFAGISGLFSVTSFAFDPPSPERNNRVIFWGVGFALFGFLAYCVKKRMSEGAPSVTRGERRPPPDEADMAACRTFEEGPEAALSAMREVSSVKDAHDPEEALRKAVHHAVPVLVDKALEDNLLTREEERAITGLFACAGIPVASMDSAARERLLKGAVVRDLLNANVHPRFSASDLPFNLQKTEIPVWLWRGVHVLRDKTVSEWRGRSQGVSIRVASGVYWRVGGSRGQKISYEVKESMGRGPLAVTSRHLYFQGDGAALRIRHDKIISMSLFDDGVVIYPDGARAKPLTILTYDAWFLINCLSNARNWE